MAMEILLFQIGNTFTNGGYLNISIRLQLCCQVHPLVPLEWCRGASRWGHIALDAWTENTDFGRTKKNLHESHLEKQIPLLMLRRQCFIIFHSWLCNGFCLLYLTKKKSIETWSSTLKVGGVLGWGGPGMDRGMIFIFFGGGGVVSMICLYICWSLYLGKWFQSLRNIRSNGLKAPKGFLLVWWIGLGHLGPVAPTKMHEMRPYHILLQWMKVG